ncbi:MAG TPA: hypothetical protein VFO63_09665 [Blastocatellia bacterium]|nr:hypothetical protein [Blastocatellia bacterium]
MGLSGYGYPGDVNNSISLASAYPGGRTFSSVPAGATRNRFRTNGAGELGAVNQGRYPRAAASAQSNGVSDVLPEPTGGVLGQPASWWIIWLVVFGVFLWAARKFAPGGGERYGNILPSLYNGVFLTLYIVLILNVLKVGATKFKIPGLSEMILAA